MNRLATVAVSVVSVGLVVLLGWAFWVQHPFVNALTWAWLRDAITNLVLIAIGGVVLWQLQDRWIRRRIRAEKDFEIQRDVYRQLSVALVDVSELRAFLSSGLGHDQGKANQLLPEATERAFRMADEARLLFDDTLQQVPFDLLVAVLGKMEPGTNIGQQQLDGLQDAVFAIRQVLLKEMDFGR